MPLIHFKVDGDPRGKERVDQNNQRGKGQRFASKASQAEEKAIAKACRDSMGNSRPFTGPIKVQFHAIFGIPASWPKALKDAAMAGRVYHTQKPDKDNIEKLVWDGLKGVAWHDDSQVSAGGGIKRFGSPARLEVWIDELTPPDGDLPPPPTPSEVRRITVQSNQQLGLLGRKASQHNAKTTKALKGPTTEK